MRAKRRFFEFERRTGWRIWVGIVSLAVRATGASQAGPPALRPSASRHANDIGLQFLEYLASACLRVLRNLTRIRRVDACRTRCASVHLLTLAVALPFVNNRFQNIGASMYDAVSIEHAFARLFEKPIGKRGEVFDADVFRLGDHARLGKLLQLTAQHLAVRIKRLKFAPVEGKAGGARARLDVAIERLREIGTTLEAQSKRSPDDIHWAIIGELVETVVALLDHVEGKGSAP